MKDYPLFPLSGIILPRGEMRLRIFEPRYVSMVKNCLKQETGFGICLIAEGEEAGTPALPYPRGTQVKILDCDIDDSGLMNIAVTGTQRFVVKKTVVAPDGLLLGDIEMMPSEKQTPLPREFAGLSKLLHHALVNNRGNNGVPLDYTESDLQDATWVSNRLCEIIHISAASRSKLIDMDDPLQRLEYLKKFISN